MGPADDTATRARGPVLVVEDDMEIRSMLVMLLEFEGFDVVSADDGLQALEWLGEGGEPALVLLDLMMPRLDGLGFLERWHALPLAYSCPVIVASGADIRHVPQGAVALLRKPVTGEELLDTVRRFLP